MSDNHKLLRHTATALFILVGIANLLPCAGLLGAERLESLYGVPLAGEDLILLMRHRAAMLGLLGAFIIFAAFRVQLRAAATVTGLVSMLSFMVLALPLDTRGEALQRVFWVDAVASVLLAAGYWATVRCSAMAVNKLPERAREG